MAVDRDSIAKSTLQGLATPLYGVVSPANRIWANPDLPKIAYDLGSSSFAAGRSWFHQARSRRCAGTG